MHASVVKHLGVNIFNMIAIRLAFAFFCGNVGVAVLCGKTPSVVATG